MADLKVHEAVIYSHVERELPFMATESLLMLGTRRGGDRQELHERLRVLSMEVHESVDRGADNDLIKKVAADPDFNLSDEDVAEVLDPQRYVGRAPEQVVEYLEGTVHPALERLQSIAPDEPRI